MKALLSALLLVLALGGPALAVQPDEVLADPALEARARALSANLRCMVCQNQSIDDSNADLARDLRVLVRDRLKAGDTDRQVMDYVVSRYGEFVLLKPRFNWRNGVLWATPAVLLIAGAAYAFARSRKKALSSDVGLTGDEERKLARILEQDD